MLQTDIEGLAPVPRRRVVLLPDDSETVTLRLPKDTASAVLETSPEVIEARLRRASQELYEATVTSWEHTNEPPCSGWWEVKVRGTEAPRYWYDATRRNWRRCRGGALRPQPIAWRGLRAQAACYDYELTPRSA